jgi:hypothetical protein
MRPEKPNNLYLWWTMALDGIEIGGPNLPIDLNSPQPGFYRMRRGGHFEPVAIFPDDDDDVMIALVGGEGNAQSHEADDRVWLRCCTNPVTEEAYRHAFKTGHWADVHPAILDHFPAIAYGSERETVAAEVGKRSHEAEEYQTLGVASDLGAEAAQSLRAKILELVKEADLKREIEKRPHLEAGRRVDEAWRDIIAGGREAAKIISRVVGSYLAKRDADATANAPAPTTIKGGYGRAASVREIRKIASVTDWPALFAHYANDPRAWDLILDLAQKDINRGLTVPHVEIVKEKALR